MKSAIENRKSKIAFMGTPEIAAIVLEKLLNSGLYIQAVFTRPDKPKGRSKKLVKSSVKLLAEVQNLPIKQPENKGELAKEMEKLKPDLIVVVAYGMILPKEVLDAPKFGAINVHPSLLPLYRGSAPISAPILNGDKKTGITIMEMNEKMDEGDILVQEEIALDGKETTPELTERLAELSGEMLTDVIPAYISGNIKPKAQDHKKATYTKMIKKEDGQIDFRKETAEEIERKSRAFLPWPGVYTHWNGKKLDLYEVEVIRGLNPLGPKGSTLLPGKVIVRNNRILIGAKKDAISPRYIKLEGKNKIPATDFLRGYSDFTKAKLD